MAEPDAVAAAGTKRLPSWGWCLTLIGFPASVFVAFGFARVLKWQKSIALAVICLASIAGFAALMIHLQENQGKDDPVDLTMMFANDAGVLMIMAWCYLIYRLGNKASYWTPSLLRSWRRAKWLAIALICLVFVSITGVLALKLAVEHMRHRLDLH